MGLALFSLFIARGFLKGLCCHWEWGLSTLLFYREKDMRRKKAGVERTGERRKRGREIRKIRADDAEGRQEKFLFWLNRAGPRFTSFHYNIYGILKISPLSGPLSVWSACSPHVCVGFSRGSHVPRMRAWGPARCPAAGLGKRGSGRDGGRPAGGVPPGALGCQLPAEARAMQDRALESVHWKFIFFLVFINLS